MIARGADTEGRVCLGGPTLPLGVMTNVQDNAMFDASVKSNDIRSSKRERDRPSLLLLSQLSPLSLFLQDLDEPLLALALRYKACEGAEAAKNAALLAVVGATD